MQANVVIGSTLVVVVLAAPRPARGESVRKADNGPNAPSTSLAAPPPTAQALLNRQVGPELSDAQVVNMIAFWDQQWRITVSAWQVQKKAALRQRSDPQATAPQSVSYEAVHAAMDALRKRFGLSEADERHNGAVITDILDALTTADLQSTAWLDDQASLDKASPPVREYLVEERDKLRTEAAVDAVKKLAIVTARYGKATVESVARHKSELVAQHDAAQVAAKSVWDADDNQ